MHACDVSPTSPGQIDGRGRMFRSTQLLGHAASLIVRRSPAHNLLQDVGLGKVAPVYCLAKQSASMAAHSIDDARLSFARANDPSYLVQLLHGLRGQGVKDPGEQSGQIPSVSLAALDKRRHRSSGGNRS